MNKICRCNLCRIGTASIATGRTTTGCLTTGRITSGRTSRHRGFTLIEMLTVLAITLVLLAIAYPGYATYVVKARRVEAQAALLELMHKQERYFTQHNTYVAFSADAAEPEAKRFRWWSGADAASSGYELRGEACPNQPISRCIAIKALPGTDRVDASFRDASCQTLTLTSTGAHSSDGPDPRCWP